MGGYVWVGVSGLHEWVGGWVCTISVRCVCRCVCMYVCGCMLHTSVHMHNIIHTHARMLVSV